MPATTEFSRDQIMEVACIACDAKVGKPCRAGHNGTGYVLVGFHDKRVELRGKLPSLGNLDTDTKLGPTDKAIITYYAYVMLCDSVATKSEELLGKRFTSAEVQRFFAKQAVIELQKDGMLR